MIPLFLYGTLRHAPLLATVSGGESLATEPATLADHRVAHAVARDGRVQNFPLFTPAPGQLARGLLIRAEGAARARLDAYERAFGYDVSRINVETAQGPVEAAIFLPQTEMWQPGADWSLSGWQLAHGDLTVAVAQEVMTLLEAGHEAHILERYPTLEQRVGNRGKTPGISARVVRLMVSPC